MRTPQGLRIPWAMPEDHLATLEAALALNGSEPDPETPETPPEEPAPEPEAAEAPEAEAEHDEQPEASAPPEQKGIRSLTDEQLVALRRAQITDADLEGLSDAALAKMADTAAKLRANYDREFDSAKNPKPPKEARSPRKGEEGAGKAAAPDPAPADLVALADPVAKALGLSGDESKVLHDFARQIVSAASAAFAPAVEEARQQAEAANQRVGDLVVESVLDELSALWPALKDSQKRLAVRKHAHNIAAGYEHLPLRVAMQECLRDSCRRELGEPKAKAVAARQPDAREKGNPAKPTGRKQAPEKPKTADQLHLELVRGIDEGLSENALRKRVGIT